MKVLAIDPGNVESGWVIIDADTRKPLEFGKSSNGTLRESILFAGDEIDHAAIEMVASYGMPVGAEVFDTCVWIGRFDAALERCRVRTDLVYRMPVKIHHCHSSKAKDSNVAQALVDRFATGQSNHGKGTKAAPGWFYGFAKDVWQAYALAVYVADTLVVRDGAA